MTISAIDTGSVLYFSHDELPTVRPLTRRRPALLRDFRRNPSFFPFSRLSFLEFPP